MDGVLGTGDGFGKGLKIGTGTEPESGVSNGIIGKPNTALEIKNCAEDEPNIKSERATEIDANVFDGNDTISGGDYVLNSESQNGFKGGSNVMFNGRNNFTENGVKNSIENGRENETKNVLEESKEAVLKTCSQNFQADFSIRLKNDSHNNSRAGLAGDSDKSMANGTATQLSDDIGISVVVGTRLSTSSRAKERNGLQSPEK